MNVPGVCVVPIHTRRYDHDLQSDVRAVVGFRAQATDGRRGPRRRTVAQARRDVAELRADGAAGGPGPDTAELVGRCYACGARNSGDACYDCGADQRPRGAGAGSPPAPTHPKAAA